MITQTPANSIINFSNFPRRFKLSGVDCTCFTTMVLTSSPAAKFFKCWKISTLITVYFCRRMLRTRIVRIILQCGMAKENASGECYGWMTWSSSVKSVNRPEGWTSSPIRTLWRMVNGKKKGWEACQTRLYLTHPKSSPSISPWCRLRIWHWFSCLIIIIASAMDNGESTAALFLDLWKAFDAIDQHSLLNKLDHYGIRGHSFNSLGL